MLLHPTSLPGPHGIGDCGAPARTFVDWLASAGMTLWQVLPLVPPGAADSPYASPSAMSGNAWLIHLDGLVDDDLLPAIDLESDPAPSVPDRVDFGAALAFKRPRLQKAARKLATSPAHPLHAPFAAFVARESWALDFALFTALRNHGGGQPWWNWPQDIRERQPAALAYWRDKLRPEVDEALALQFLFDRQWRGLRNYAADKGIRFMGDVPIYVDADSADTWAAPHLFQLDASRQPKVLAGVPPDYFSETGQFWGNPLYDWTAMAKEGYRWWAARLQRALAQTDLVRIDHFRGFSAYWAIPAGAEDARAGQWLPGPGLTLFKALERALGKPLPLVAEDLGVSDAALVELRESVGLPGMAVLQFAFGGEATNPFLPHLHLPHQVVYSGTHDNNTTIGWWQASPGVQDHVRRYFGIDGTDVAWDLIRAALASVAHTAIVPMQDVLALGSEARMNVPGVTEGNWNWRLRPDQMAPATAARLRDLAGLYGRLPAP